MDFVERFVDRPSRPGFRVLNAVSGSFTYHAFCEGLLARWSMPAAGPGRIWFPESTLRVEDDLDLPGRTLLDLLDVVDSGG
jgi:hypothetical protein